MQKKEIEVALEFLRIEPENFGKILQAQEPKDVVILLKNITNNQVSTIIELILPQYAAKVCELLGIDKTAKILGKINHSELSFILRYCPHNFRNQVLDKLAINVSAACNLLLNYSEDTVGAWMRQEIMIISNKSTINEALSLVSNPKNTIDSDVIFLADRYNHFQGMIKLSKLLKANLETSILTIIERNIEPILGGAELDNIGRHKSWLMQDCLPVINKNNKLLGVIKYVDVQNALELKFSKLNQSTNNDNDLIFGIYETYGSTLVTLFNTLFNLTNSKS